MRVVRLRFKGYETTAVYDLNGAARGLPSPAMFDIISWTAPPMTDAEKLAVIETWARAYGTLTGGPRLEDWKAMAGTMTRIIKLISP